MGQQVGGAVVEEVVDVDEVALMGSRQGGYSGSAGCFDERERRKLEAYETHWAFFELGCEVEGAHANVLSER